jgi:hypothetical protein
MAIEAPCQASNSDINMMEPIWIDAKEILKQTPGDQEFMFQTKYASHVKFSDVVDEWPEAWEITSVRLFNSVESAKGSIAVSTTNIPKEKRLRGQQVLSLK